MSTRCTNGERPIGLTSLTGTSHGAQGTLRVMVRQTVGQLSLNEMVVAALLVEGDAHGFALAKELAPDSDLGRILTVRRPLVYRALDRVVAAGLAEHLQSEPGDSGPTRTVHTTTTVGRRSADTFSSVHSCQLTLGQALD